MAELFDDDEEKRKEEMRKKLLKLKEDEKKFLSKLYGEQGNLFVKPIPSSDDLNTGPNAGEVFDADMETLLDDSEDPEFVRAMWNEAQNMILGAIPKGQLRRFVLDEKKLFLQGSSNTSDSKFSFKAANHRAFTMVESWVRSEVDTEGIELGMAFWQLNESLGFHSLKTQAKFTTTLEAHLNMLRARRGKGTSHKTD